MDIQNKIYQVRGFLVMLDFDLAEMYETETRVLNQAVKRNIKRFPPDFMFQLTDEEFHGIKSQATKAIGNSSQIVMSSNHEENLKSQIVTSSWGGVRKLPYAFTEHGVTMYIRHSYSLQSKKSWKTNHATR
jgi:hypothetical protein